jgi:hypothetical protein
VPVTFVELFCAEPLGSITAPATFIPVLALVNVDAMALKWRERTHEGGGFEEINGKMSKAKPKGFENDWESGDFGQEGELKWKVASVWLVCPSPLVCRES